MAQSLAHLGIHLVFSTKERRPYFDTPELRANLHAYMAGVLRGYNSTAVEVGGTEDHVHMLFQMARTISIADLTKNVKRAATRWISEQDAAYSGFHWQAGYGAFSVSASNMKQAGQYIRDQEVHHRKMGFQDELRMLLRKHGIEWDESYIWQ